MKNRHEQRTILDDDLCAGTHTRDISTAMSLARRFRFGDVDQIPLARMITHPSCALYFGRAFPFFLGLCHRARAAFVASAFLSCGVRAAMRAFTPFPLAAFPPFLPISRMTFETRSRLIALSYDE